MATSTWDAPRTGGLPLGVIIASVVAAILLIVATAVPTAPLLGLFVGLPARAIAIVALVVPPLLAVLTGGAIGSHLARETLFALSRPGIEQTISRGGCLPEVLGATVTTCSVADGATRIGVEGGAVPIEYLHVPPERGFPAPEHTESRSVRVLGDDWYFVVSEW